MALNVLGTVSQIKVEQATRKDGTPYEKYKVTLMTNRQDGSKAFIDIPVILTKNVDKSLLGHKGVEVQGWLNTDGEFIQLMVNKLTLVEKGEEKIPF